MGSLLAIFSFFQSTVGKVVLYTVAGLLVFGALTAAYLKWEHKVQEAERYRLETIQLHQTIVQQNKTISDQTAVMKFQEQTSTQFNAQVNDIRKTEQEVNSAIDTSTDDRPSSEVLKNTFRQLYGVTKK